VAEGQARDPVAPFGIAATEPVMPQQARAAHGARARNADIRLYQVTSVVWQDLPGSRQDDA
jgi:hypothetical protein